MLIRIKLLFTAVLLCAPGSLLAAPCDSLSKDILGQFDGGAGYTLGGCDTMPPGKWQAMEKEAREKCQAGAKAWRVRALSECMTFCTKDDQGNTLACLPAPVLPTIPPAECQNVNHSITQSGTGPGCRGIQWHYNFTTTANATLKCNCRGGGGGGGGSQMFEIDPEFLFEGVYP